MKLNFKRISVWLGAACLLVSTLRTSAFALLGPVQPWMQATNGVLRPDDIGGPMDLNCEYRWNVPVVTYGFDQSFLDYFGTNGVAAVESAIKILNDLPPSSSLVLTNYSFSSRQYNSSPQTKTLFDLKSATLTRLLEQLGLASPMRNIYVIHSWDPILSSSGNLLSVWYFDPYQTATEIFDYIARLNFDPLTLAPTPHVNGVLYGAGVHTYMGANTISIGSVDPFVSSYNAAADDFLSAGHFFTNLSYDDAGGLRYLLAATNLNYETLLPDVHGVEGNGFVNGAWRPGVEKITFVRQPAAPSPGTFQPLTNAFTDTFVLNDNTLQQPLERVTTRPDFLFTAGNDFARTGTTNWINNAALNFNPTGAGPGVIQPPVVITFQKLGSYFYSGGPEELAEDVSTCFGSFDGSTNEPIVYPGPRTGNLPMTIRVVLFHHHGWDVFQTIEWSPTSQFGTVYAFQTSSNLAAWTTLLLLTNNGSVNYVQNNHADSPSQFYRLLPQ